MNAYAFDIFITHSIVMKNFEEDGIYTTTCDLVEVGSLNIMDFNNFKRMPEQRWYRSLHGNKAIAKNQAGCSNFY